MYDRRLRHHLATWLGRWPPSRAAVEVVGSARRRQPAWDGNVHPAVGVLTPHGGVLSVAPETVAAVREVTGLPLDQLAEVLPTAAGLPGRGGYRTVYRWTVHPMPLPEAGVWVPADDPVVPDWLRVFGGEVLIARHPETGRYLAGVGRKRHDAYGQEIAVGTEPAARGRGLARRLVAQAARRILDEGAVATYQHDLDNTASARVAQAAGFPDRGWLGLGVNDAPPV